MGEQFIYVYPNLEASLKDKKDAQGNVVEVAKIGFYLYYVLKKKQIWEILLIFARFLVTLPQNCGERLRVGDPRSGIPACARHNENKFSFCPRLIAALRRIISKEKKWKKH